MFNSVVLDVVIGLVFIYLLYSLLVTIIQEIIASFFGFRAKILQRAVFRMLEDENKFNSRFSSLFYLFKNKGNGGDPGSTTFEFYNHPLIKFLGENSRHASPAYINKETFSKVLIDLLRGEVRPEDDIKKLIQDALDGKTTKWGNSGISKETLKYLNSIWADAQGDVDKFKVYLESWFDATMERASGWYKKHTQFILFFVGFIIAVIFNVDTIKIVDKLEKDPKLREQIVQQADAFVKEHPNLDQDLIQLKNQVGSPKTEITSADSSLTKDGEDSLNLANFDALKGRRDLLFKKADSLINNDLKNTNNILGIKWREYQCKSGWVGCILKSLSGWIITALALSLGAPFWFDLLNKMMKMRGSVATASNNKQKQKEPKS